MTRDLTAVQVGDVILVSLYGRDKPSESTVTAVARKYLTVKDGSKFDRATGLLAGQYMGQAWTAQQWEEAERLRAVRRDLDRLGVETWQANLTLEQALAIRAIVKEEQ